MAKITIDEELFEKMFDFVLNLKTVDRKNAECRMSMGRRNDLLADLLEIQNQRVDAAPLAGFECALAEFKRGM